MRANTTTTFAGRMAWFAICAVGLTGVGGCQDSATGPQTAPQNDGETMTSSDVNIIVSDDYADAGDEVQVMFQLPEIERGAEVVLEATLTWDPASFEYVDTEPLRSLEILDSDLENGWMRVRGGDLDSREDGWIVVIFVALRGAETSGFTAHTRIRLAPFDG